MANKNPREATEMAAQKRRAAREAREKIEQLRAGPRFVMSEELDGLKDEIAELESALKTVKNETARGAITAELAALRAAAKAREEIERSKWQESLLAVDERAAEVARLEALLVKLAEPADHNETRRLKRAHERMKRVTAELQAEIDSGQLRLYGPFGEERWFVVLTKEEYDDGVRVDSEGFVDEPSTAEFRAKYYPEEWAEQQAWDEKFAFLSTSLDTNVRESRKRAERLANAEEDLLLAETHVVVRNLHDEPEDVERRTRAHDAQVARLRSRVADCKKAHDTADEAYKEARRRLDLFTSQGVYVGVFRGRLVNEER